MPRKKRGPGHPVTTGMASTPPVHYRVSRDQYNELAMNTRGLSPNQEAKRRAFPKPGHRERKQGGSKR